MTSCQPQAWARVVFSYCLLFASQILPGQSSTISSTINHDAEYLIREVFLAGECFEVFNIEIDGATGQAGTFSNGTASIGLDTGIVLSNGNVRDISGPNTESDTSTDYGRPGNDPDLELLSQLEGDVGNLGQADLIILEFDFIPTVSNASFNFVFASEEYCEFALSTFYDTFGFFVSGPGINGPFSDNAQNVAIVPNTTSPITARNVNFFNNSAYYVNNTPSSFGQACTLGQPAASPNFITFDGYTIPLSANFLVEPCQTYHLKFVVADRSSDASWDSAVFLEASSFAAGLTSDISGTVRGPSPSENAGLEGCGEAVLIFSRGDSILTNDLVINYDILPSSTATEGVDFSEIPDSIVIPAGTFSDTVVVELFADNIPEGLEFFTVKLDLPCKCSRGELSFSIVEPPPLSADLSGRSEICLSESIELVATPTSGNGIISYEWDNGDRDSIYNIAPTTTRSHTVTLTDECGQEEIVATEVIVNAPTAELSGTITICDGLPVDSLTIRLDGASTYDFDLAGTSDTLNFTGISADSVRVPVIGTSVYELFNLMGDGCSGQVMGVASVVEVDVEIELELDTISCFAGSDGSATLLPQGGDGDYTYEWAHAPALTGNTATGLSNTSYFALARDARGCQDTISFIFPQPSPLVLRIDSIRAFASCRSGGSLALNINGGTAPYMIDWSNGDTTVLVDNLPAATYQADVIDANGCRQMATAGITDQTTPPPVPVVATPAVLDCDQNSVEIDARASDQNPAYRYHWLDPNGDSLALADPLLWTTGTVGVYTLIATNILTGCQESTSTEVRNNTSTLAVNIAAAAPTLDCNTNSISLIATENNGNPVNWQWTSDTGLIEGDPTAANVDARTAGWYYLRGDAPGSNCFGIDSVLISVDTLAPALQLSSETILSCSAPTAQLSVTPTGTSSYNYNWQTDGVLQGDPTTASITAAAAGTYDLTVTDVGNGCTTTTNFDLTDNRTNVELEPIEDQMLNCTTTTIALQAQASGGSNFNFFWINTAGDTLARTADYTLTEAAGLTVVAINPDNGCNNSTNFEVQVDTLAPIAIIPLPDTLTCTIDTIGLTTSIINPGWEPRWEDELGNLLGTGNWTQNITTQGDYTLIVTNANNGCRATAQTTVARIDNPPVATLPEADTLDCTVQQVELAVQVTSAGSYDYTWTGPVNGLDGPTDVAAVIGTRPGEYSVTVTDQQTGCSENYSLTVTEDISDLLLNPIADTSLTCIRTQIELVGTSPNPNNLSFRWLDDQGNEIANSATVNITSAGNYELEATNLSNGCDRSLNVAVGNDTTDPVVVVNDILPLTCERTTSTLSAEPGPATWQTRWLDSNGDTLARNQWTFVTSIPTDYQLLVIDAENGCRSLTTYELPADTIAPVVSIPLPDTLTCTVDTIDLTASIINPGWEPRWEDELGNLLGTGNWTQNITTQGDYTLIVTNANNGCRATAQTTVARINNPPVATLNEPDTLDCTRQQVDLELQVTATGNYEYTWTGPVNGLDGPTDVAAVIGTRPGEYSVTVTDQQTGCSENYSLTVTEDISDLLLNPIADTSLTCIRTQIELVGTSPNPNNLSFRWLDDQGNEIANSATVNITSAGNYELEATNLSNGCDRSLNVVVGNDTTDPVVVVNDILPLTCERTTSTLSAEPGLATWQTRWLDSNGDTLARNQWTFVTSIPTDYQLLVIDTENGCRSLTTYELLADTIAPVASILPLRALTCQELQVSIESQVSGDSDDYTYQWSGPSGGIVGDGQTANISVAQAGQYTLFVTDNANGCRDTLRASIMDNSDRPQLSVPADTALTCVVNTITLQANSTTAAALTYQWTNEDGNVLSQTDNLSVNSVGSFTVVLTNTDNGCTNAGSLNVLDNRDLPPVEAGPAVTIGCSDNEVTLQAEVGPDTYSTRWLNNLGEVLLTNSWQLNTTEPGLYTLEVINPANNCVNTDTVRVLNNQDTPLIRVNDSQVDCFTGTATIDLTGSATGPQINYALFTEDGLLLTSGTTTDLSVEAAGRYELVLTDNSNGCSAAASFNVTSNLPVIQDVAISSPQCLENRGLIEVIGIDGGTAPFVYALDDGNFTPLAAFGNLSADTYEVRVQDANGCEDRREVQVTGPSPVEIILRAEHEIKLGESLRLNAQVNRDSTTLSSIRWEPAELLSCADCLRPNVLPTSSQLFELTVIDANGCVGVAKTRVLVDEQVPVYIPTAFSPNEDGSNDRFVVFGDPAQITQIVELKIFDRWGTMIFAQEDIAPNNEGQSWDGTFKGSQLNGGVYIYLVRVQLVNGEVVPFQGEVILMR